MQLVSWRFGSRCLLFCFLQLCPHVLLHWTSNLDELPKMFLCWHVMPTYTLFSASTCVCQLTESPQPSPQPPKDQTSFRGVQEMVECLRVTKCLKPLKIYLSKQRREILFRTSTKKYVTDITWPVVSMWCLICQRWTSHNTKTTGRCGRTIRSWGCWKSW